MARKLLVFILLFTLTASFTTVAFAQEPPAGEEGTTKARGIGGPRRQLATILFAGLGGSILGLSTLSFYGRPQDKLSNIAIGFAVGVIAGTVYVTSKAVSNPQELYGKEYMPEVERIAQAQQLRVSEPTPLSASYTFTF